MIERTNRAWIVALARHQQIIRKGACTYTPADSKRALLSLLPVNSNHIRHSI